MTSLIVEFSYELLLQIVATDRSVSILVLSVISTWVSSNVSQMIFAFFKAPLPRLEGRKKPLVLLRRVILNIVDLSFIEDHNFLHPRTSLGT